MGLNEKKKGSKWIKWIKIGLNGLKWVKMVLKGLKWVKMGSKRRYVGENGV